MKKLITSITTGLFLLIAISGCEKDDNTSNNRNNANNNNGTTHPDYFLSLAVNDTSYYIDSAHSRDGYFIINEYPEGNIWLAVRCDSFDMLIMVDSSYHGVGTYSLNSYNYPGPTAQIQFDLNNSSLQFTTDSTYTGTLTIMSDGNNVIKGSFDFYGRPSDYYYNGGDIKHITNGQFCLPIQHL